jgi:DNA-binding beta-propeller fold protein YncE
MNATTVRLLPLIGALSGAWAGANGLSQEAEPRFLVEWGRGVPAAPGVLTFTIGNAFDSTRGFFYLYESNRVQKFDRDGRYLAHWSCNQCAGLEVNEVTGYVYAASDANHRVTQFTSDGAVIRQWGSFGSEPGQFRYPFDVAVDTATGNVYVSDPENARIQQFDPQGLFIRSFGSRGAGTGQLTGRRSPMGVAFDTAGRVLYVTEPFRRAVLKFDATGNFLLDWDSNDSPAPGGIRWPREVEVDAAGNVHVAAADSEMILVFDPLGTLLEYYQGPNNREQGAFHPRDVAVDRVTGDAYVNAAYAYRVDRLDAGRRHLHSFGSRDTYAYAFQFPRSLAASPLTGDVYVFDSLNFLLKRFSPGGAFLGQWGGSNRIDETATGLFNFAGCAAAVGGDGGVWVAINFTHYSGDTPGMILQKFQPAGAFLKGYPLQDGPGIVQTAYNAVAIDDASGDVYVSDAVLNNVQVYDAAGRLARQVLSPVIPAGLAICGGSLYVVDAGSQTVKNFDLQGDLIREWGSPTGFRFRAQSGIACDVAGGRLYLADTDNQRIQWYDLGGTFLGQFGALGSGPGQFRVPLGVALSPAADILYVLDLNVQRVQAFCLTADARCVSLLDADADGALDAADNCSFASNPDQSNADLDAAGDVCDCGAQDPAVWAAPGPARLLRFDASGAGLQWLAPLEAGGAPDRLRYDTLRTPDPSDLVAAATCIETDDGPNTLAGAAEAPPQGGVFYYVVRPRTCAPGSAGASSAGRARDVRSCP